jgi:hypothetical protein
VSLDRRHIDGRRKEIDDGVEHCLHALVLEGGAAEHRHDESTDRRASDSVTDLVVGELLMPEVLLDQSFVV